MLKNKEFDKQLERDREAAEAERVWEEQLRASWSVFFMDWCYYPLAYFLVLFVVFNMAIDGDWVAMREDYARFQEERRQE
jgi:hypothetical protein